MWCRPLHLLRNPGPHTMWATDWGGRHCADGPSIQHVHHRPPTLLHTQRGQPICLFYHACSHTTLPARYAMSSTNSLAPFPDMGTAGATCTQCYTCSTGSLPLSRCPALPLREVRRSRIWGGRGSFGDFGCHHYEQWQGEVAREECAGHMSTLHGPLAAHVPPVEQLWYSGMILTPGIMEWNSLASMKVGPVCYISPWWPEYLWNPRQE